MIDKLSKLKAISWKTIGIKRFAFIGLFIYCCCAALSAQDLNFQKINYTIEDGLPSNECHDLLQDSSGHIWIATDRGLVRFDGYEFKSYGIPEGLTNISCLNLEFDKYQNIWIYTLGGQMFKCETKTETITPFKYQNVIDSLLNFNAFILDFAVDDDDQLIIATNAFGFISIQIENGEFHLIRGDHKDESLLNFTVEVKNNLLLSKDHRKNLNLYMNNDECYKVPTIDGESWNCQTEIKHKGNLFQAQLNLSKNEGYNTPEAFHLSDNSSIIQVDGVTYFFVDEKLIKAKTNDQYFTDIIKFKDRTILVGGIFRDGLMYFNSYQKLIDYQGKSLLENISISKILVDKEDNIWASSLENGLFYLKKNPIQILPIPKLDNAFINNIEVNNETVFLVAEKNKLIKYQNGKFESISWKIKEEIRSILFIKYIKKLIVGGSKKTIAIDEIGNQKYFKVHSLSYSVLGYTYSNKIFSFSENEVFLCTAKDILKYKNINKLPVYRHISESSEPIRVLAMEKINSDYFLLGTTKGLRCLKNNKVEHLSNYPSELNNRINAILQYQDGYIFGTQGNGIYFWNLKDKRLHIREQDGLISNNIETLFIDDQSNLFIGTKTGLSKMDLNDLDNYQIKNYTRFHGLPSNDVMDIDQKGDSILLATSKGIGVLLQDPTPAKKHQPMITGIQVNNDWFDMKEVVKSFSYDKNNIKIVYKSIDFKMQSAIPYRYQLNKGGWVESMATEVNYPALPSGEYTFQLQSQNIDKQWGDTAIFEFTINEPWWRSAWFFAIYLLSLIMLGYLFYKNRTNRLKQKLAIEREIRDLERSALQAQMNPHFIFNCLNSIQKGAAQIVVLINLAKKNDERKRILRNSTSKLPKTTGVKKRTEFLRV